MGEGFGVFICYDGVIVDKWRNEGAGSPFHADLRFFSIPFFKPLRIRSALKGCQHCKEMDRIDLS